MSIFDTLQDWGGSAAETVQSWSWVEDDESPKTANEQAQAEKLAEGSSLPQVDNAQTNTGAAVSPTGYSMGANSTLLIGGGILLVVLVFVALMLRGK